MSAKKPILLLVMLLGAALGFSQTFTLKSQTLSGQATQSEFANSFGCTGENFSPQLSWENTPEGTKSYAITIYDPDAPTGSGFWHWLAFDIPATVSSIAQNASGNGSMPAGTIEGKNDYGNPGYGGPCPPEGDSPHRYIVTVFALKTEKLGPDASASSAVIGFYLNANAIQKASLIFFAQR